MGDFILTVIVLTIAYFIYLLVTKQVELSFSWEFKKVDTESDTEKNNQEHKPD